MHRTQIYLDRDIHERLNSMAAHRGTTLSYLVREALAQYVVTVSASDPTAIIDRACGLWADRSDEEVDVRALREGWATREASLADRASA